mmetsp:Transcript_6568/g.9929  ORF Transcript_6568/g.9929 Transcript_6568/m.9929 type:complete len:97 (+) Transcript_6568:38-328(+)|eukprot:CAMPEP_0113940170 /NCGR_PEP_ID=MMETSP1339-20121228/6349_1 /TAXON_ID=94617 /ORGANISM="Fibrocapsa japonica" /LENGTH=96 /DNA_ID=CAMNT_0000943887 /DNA_START=37 /DNA_END=327 /DNA_ORIENTATION=- /assembly_acc=CAM_ASM_000762
MAQLERTVPQIYRDCLRLITHIASKSSKASAIRSIVRNEFKKNKDVTDPKHVEVLKGSATRALSNYLFYESGMKDKKLKPKMEEKLNTTFSSKDVK